MIRLGRKEIILLASAAVLTALSACRPKTQRVKLKDWADPTQRPLPSSLSGRERGERDSRHAQRDGNEDQRGVHDVRQLEPEHRSGLHTGGHAHVLQHQDILGHQVGHEYVGSEQNLAKRKINTMKFLPTTFLRKCAIACSPKHLLNQ